MLSQINERERDIRQNALSLSIKSLADEAMLLHTAPTTDEIVQRAQAFAEFIVNGSDKK